MSDDERGIPGSEIKQQIDIVNLSPKQMVSATIAGVDHRLNNAISLLVVLTGLNAEELEKTAMLVGGIKIRDDDLEEIANGAIAGNKESLTQVMRESCRLYVERYTGKMRESGFGGTTDAEVIGQWREYVSGQLEGVTVTTDDEEILGMVKRSWGKTLKIIDDIVGVASGGDLPPIYDYREGYFFVDFGRMGPN